MLPRREPPGDFPAAASLACRHVSRALEDERLARVVFLATTLAPQTEGHLSPAWTPCPARRLRLQ